MATLQRPLAHTVVQEPLVHELLTPGTARGERDYPSRATSVAISCAPPSTRTISSGVRAELAGRQAEKCLLLSGDDISPNKLTMPPVAIESIRNIWREAQASCWEACHVAKPHVTKPDHIWFLGFIEDLVRAFSSAMATDKNRYGGT